jgi:hypothetical protein
MNVPFRSVPCRAAAVLLLAFHSRRPGACAAAHRFRQGPSLGGAPCHDEILIFFILLYMFCAYSTLFLVCF